MSLRALTVIIHIYKAIRGLIVTAVVAAILLPVAAYVILSSEWAQRQIRDRGQEELSRLLGTEVRIGEVDFSPFNMLRIHDVSALDDNDSTALRIRTIAARVEMWDYLMRRKTIIDYATIEGLEVRLYRDSASAPLNIDRIVRSLTKPKTDDKETEYRLRLNDLYLRDCSLSYDVLDAPETPGRFNPRHIRLTDIELSAFAPVIANDDYQLRLRTLRMTEQSGLMLSDLKVNGYLTPHYLKVSDLEVEMPLSRLAFDDMEVGIHGLKDLANIGMDKPVHVGVKEGSHVYLPDLRSLAPALEYLDYDLDITLDARASRSAVYLADLRISDSGGILRTQASGSVSGLENADSLRVQGLSVEMVTDTVSIKQVLSSVNIGLDARMRSIIGHLGTTTISAKADGSLESGNVQARVRSPLASAEVQARLHRRGPHSYGVKGTAQIDSARLDILTGNSDLRGASARVEADGTIGSDGYSGEGSARIGYIDYKGYRYHNIEVDGSLGRSHANAAVSVRDPNIALALIGDWDKGSAMQEISLSLAVDHARLDTLRLWEAYSGYALSGALKADVSAESVDRLRGSATLSNLAFVNADGEGPRLRNLEISADNLGGTGRIAVASELVNATVDGEYRLSTLAHDAMRIVQSIVPAISDKPRDEESEATEGDNNFAYDITVNPCQELCEFFGLPVSVVNPVTLNGYLRSDEATFHMMLDTQWLALGSNSYIEDPDIVVDMDGRRREGRVFVECRMPTKKGMMEVSTRIGALDGTLDTDIWWTLVREKPINGDIVFSTRLSRDEDNELVTRVNINPGKINFGNEIWSIQPAEIEYARRKATIRNFALITDPDAESAAHLGETTPPRSPEPPTLATLGLDSGTQSIRVNGELGDDELDQLTVDLRNIQLINIFETLDIDKALISGYATGTVRGAALLSKSPIIECDALSIKEIGYNYCTIGDAVARLNFDEGGTRFNFSADISQNGEHHSRLSGYIIPATEELRLNIDADYVNVGFMKPFMSAFTSDVKGYASGHALLYGTFKDIDLKGDIYVDSLGIKIDFTNTWYYASDSIHIRPGIIQLQNILIRDEYGSAAMLNGWVGHKYFHEATFDFNVTDARNFLCYDVTEKLSPVWYGKIFGDGWVTVKGVPGRVDINARITTVERTTFTFVLTDQEEADEYKFITFRDVTPRAPTDSILGRNTTPEMIQRIIERNSNATEDEPTDYNMDLEVVATPAAELIIVMDPVGGDRITAHGSGSMRMEYKSVDNDLRLYGKYELQRGDYNFTLQDIIRKEFTIKPNSTIEFSGDPYLARLNIDAYASIPVNLSDLDESFLQDKELNRTKVVARALLLLRGDMLQPNISFDLEFPTLNDDTYRKVKSIISTEDMMSKQIIYLLALNRFYTPEYMASTTKGNELFSVASSTLGSQLSNMLGKLSDNWSIAPNLRSDRGDFSDIEVDLTLSSSLLNNRLLFNGNFGYRDKSLNTNQFVGDFDIEYLLNNSGIWRLKAYNRYNDQNYYLRTAQTTQGIGVVYRKDFDKTMRLLRKLRFWEKDPAPESEGGNAASDTIAAPETSVPQQTWPETPVQEAATAEAATAEP